MKRDNRQGPRLLPDGNLPRPRRLERHELASWVGVTGRRILDLRRDRGAFMEKHLKGSLFTPPVGGKLPAAAGSYADEDDRLLVLVEREEDLDTAVRELIRIGLDQVEAWMPVAEALEETGLTTSLERLSSGDLEQALAASSGGVVLDVRGAGEFAEGHVKGATNLAYTRLVPGLEKLPGNGPLFIHCASGMRAALASAFLASEGREVIHVDGAFTEIAKSLRE